MVWSPTNIHAQLVKEAGAIRDAFLKDKALDLQSACTKRAQDLSMNSAQGTRLCEFVNAQVHMALQKTDPQATFRVVDPAKTAACLDPLTPQAKSASQEHYPIRELPGVTKIAAAQEPTSIDPRDFEWEEPQPTRTKIAAVADFVDEDALRVQQHAEHLARAEARHLAYEIRGQIERAKYAHDEAVAAVALAYKQGSVDAQTIVCTARQHFPDYVAGLIESISQCAQCEIVYRGVTKVASVLAGQDLVADMQRARDAAADLATLADAYACVRWADVPEDDYLERSL